ncbi:DUF4435 domain-containing protein [Acinetobacter bereziniae]|uniref:DUF4435 domain-containing protein n=1 Tax=Acinetobacter bereziniae NIPH 3 TaxID=1217651 RepID=N8YN67_ACIBZ|nr:DUF4435 domain-containing protein [Acinetobacter bereziniae]ENV20695.1 hypothetical protein F963_03275 [Acinetobacter bereziniae NIPH 3]MBJ8553703.1 DUF4435 domain-containing protein [Acinetobacter bereziniae]
MQRINELIIPKDDKDKSIIVNESEQIIIVGGNGVGKSRLGFYIEQNNQDILNKIIRISAQRSLSLSKEIYADNHSYENFKEKTQKDIKRQKKFEDFIDFEQEMLFDFDDLLIYLFSKHQFEIYEHRKISKKGIESELGLTLLEKVIQLWNMFITNKKMEEDYKELNITFDGIEHNASLLSDGERVIFYLIGQVLASPPCSILVIDEPELHIHKGLHKKLWDELENQRPDNLYIYITHDLSFAASRSNAKKVWIKDYIGDDLWDWELIESIDNLPDDILFELLGSRKDILFVEGDPDSYDTKLYTLLFSEYSVIPVGGCNNVIRCTEAFNSQKKLHHLKVAGLIDRDRRVDLEVNNLRKNNISVLDVAEVENIFLIPEILKMISDHLAFSNKNVEKAQSLIIKRLQEKKNEQISLHTMSEIKFQLSNIDTSRKSLSSIKEYINQKISNLDTDQIYSNYEEKIEKIIIENNYEEALKVFNDKSLVRCIEPIFNLKSEKGNSELINLILRLLIKNPNFSKQIKNAVIKYTNLKS